MKAAVTILAMIAATVPAESADFPFSGTLTSTSENTSLTYECSQQPDGSLHCNFSEVLVSKDTPTSPKDRAKTIQQMVATPMDAKTCATITASVAQARAGQLPNQNLAPEAVADIVKLFETYADSCSHPGDASRAAAVLDALAEKSAKSCKVGTLTFELDMSFNRETERWESISPANGPCGTITAAHFEKDSPSANIQFWNYSQKRLVTNTLGKDIFGQDCAATSQEEQRFVWQQREIYPKCSFISFGLF